MFFFFTFVEALTTTNHLRFIGFRRCSRPVVVPEGVPIVPDLARAY